MKVFLILAVLAAVAHAKINLFVNNKQIESPHLERMDFTEIKFKKDFKDVQDIPHTRNIIDDTIIGFLEGARDRFEEGFPELGIPPLDPFQLDEAKIELNQPLVFKATITAQNVLLTGLKDFIIETIKFNVIRLSFDFDFTVPDIVFDSKFLVKGRVAVVRPFELDAHVRSRMQKLTFGGNMALGTNADGYLTLKTFTLAIDMSEMSLNVDGLPEDGPIGEIVDWISSQLTNEFLHDALASVSKAMSEGLFDSINEVLGTIKLSDIIG